MFKIIDLIIPFLFLLFLYLNTDTDKNVVKILGGGLSFIPAWAFISLLSYAYKKFQPYLSGIGIITVAFIGLHYIAYLEVNKIIPFLYILILFSSSTFLLFICFLFINTSLIKSKDEKIKRGILERFIFTPLFGIVYVVIYAGFPFIIGAESKLIKNNIIVYSNIAITLIILSYLITIVFLKKIDKKYIQYILKDTEKEYILNLRRRFWIGMIILFIFGSISELFRGYWFFWFGTYLAIICIVIAAWQLWKYILEPVEKYNLEEIASEGLSSITEFKNIVIFLILNTLIGTIFFVGLIALLALYR